MRFTAILISVTERCHVGCAHCGFIGAVREREPEPQEMVVWVTQACEYGMPLIIFTGGEPFERFDCLAQGVAAAERSQVPAAVFTSSYWASSPETTRSMLRELPGIKHLYLSSDVFHQRRVPYENVFNAIEVGMSLSIPTITICITYSNEDERREVRQRYAGYGDRLRFSEERVIPNPHFSAKILQHQGVLLAPHAEKYSCQCEIGTPIVNPNGDVFSCHIGKAAAHRDLRHLPYFLGNLHEKSFNDIMTAASNRSDYQFLRTHGPRGVTELFKQNPDLIKAIGRDGFTNACDMCFSTMKTPEGSAALSRYVSSPTVQDDISMRLALTLNEEPLQSV